jgi:hypothetical protein
MDDLDRLEPTELLMTFKLIRLVGRLPHVHYLLAYDEQTLLDVLCNTELAGDGDHAQERAKEYLEKIVQFRLDLPVFRPDQRDRLISAEFDRCFQSGVLRASQTDIERFSLALDVHIRVRLATARSILRFFAQVGGFASVLDGEVSVGDLLIATWIRTAEPRLWQELHTRREDLVGLGEVAVAVLTSDQQKIDLLRAKWREILSSRGVDSENVDGVLKVLAILFPSMQRMLADNQVVAPDERRGIGDPDYFETYFAFGVPAGQVTDAEVRRLVSTVSDPGWMDRDGKELRALLLEHGELVAQKLAFALDESSTSRVSILIVLRDVAELDPSPGGAIACPRRSAEVLAQRLINAGGSSLFADMLDRWRDDDWGIRILGQSLHRAGYEFSADPDAHGQRVDDLLGALESRLNFLRSSKSADELTDPEWFLTWVWNWLRPNDRQTWLRESTRSGNRDALEVASRFVESEWASSDNDWRLNMDELEAAVGIEFVANLVDLPAEQEPLERSLMPGESWSDFRRRIAILDLVRHQRAQSAGQAEQPEAGVDIAN